MKRRVWRVITDLFAALFRIDVPGCGNESKEGMHCIKKKDHWGRHASFSYKWHDGE